MINNPFISTNTIQPPHESTVRMINNLLIFPASSRPPWSPQSLLLLALPVPILLAQAYLLFSPQSPPLVLLRRAILPFAILGILPMGFTHIFDGIHHFSDLNNLFGLYTLVLVGVSLELGLRHEAPKWLGWEGDAKKGGTEEKEEGIEKTDTRLERLRISWRYITCKGCEFL